MDAWIKDHVQKIDEMNRIIILNTLWRDHLNDSDVELTWNATCGSNSPELCAALHNLRTTTKLKYAPIAKEKEWEVISVLLRTHDEHNACYAFVGEYQREAADDEGFIDEPDAEQSKEPLDSQDKDHGPVIGLELAAKTEAEMELLDSLQMAGFPKDEEARRKAWMALPRAARAAIRRLHNISAHKPISVMVHLLKGARADAGLIRACKLFKCGDCQELSPPDRVVKFKMPST
jgi:hypothetical protein